MTALLPITSSRPWASTDSTAHRGLQNSTPKRQRFMNFGKKIFTKRYFTTSTFNIRWALLNIWIDQMFQVRTAVHCVHSSPVNGTRVTRVVIKTILTQKNLNIKNTKCILLPLLCHTLATSLTPRVTRCRKLGLLCPLYMLCTRQSQTQWSTMAQSSAFPSPGNQGTNTMWSTREGFGSSSPNNISNES